MRRIKVVTPSSSYRVLVGSSRKEDLFQQEMRTYTSDRCYIIFDSNVFALHGEATLARLASIGMRPEPFVIPAGESAKSAQVLDSLYDFLLARGISRTDVLVGCGGGVTTDVTGFAAATILRGVDWVAIPTSLLGVVDAAVGGKTGINHARGKNLIGAFWQPRLVVCDLDYLCTLPHRELVAGFGEIVKYAGLIGKSMVATVSQLLTRGIDSTVDWTGLVRSSIEYKSHIVSMDELERGKRAVLNLGHTFGHAIEHALGYGKLRHGEAVIVGLFGAVALSQMRRQASQRYLKEYYQLLLKAVALVPRFAIDSAAIAEAMALDKKRARGGLQFVLLSAPGKPYIEANVPDELVRAAIHQMLDDYNQYGGTHATSARRQRS